MSLAVQSPIYKSITSAVQSYCFVLIACNTNDIRQPCLVLFFLSTRWIEFSPNFFQKQVLAEFITTSKFETTQLKTPPVIKFLNPLNEVDSF